MRIISLLLFITLLVTTSCHNISFDSDKWKSWEESEVDMRMRLDMVDDLMSEYELVGKSTSKIIDLLGEPDNKNKDFWMSYNLGFCRGHLIGNSYGVLNIEFENGKVVKVDKYCH